MKEIIKTSPKFKIGDRVKLTMPPSLLNSYDLGKALYGEVVEYEYRKKKQLLSIKIKKDHCYKVLFDTGVELSWFNEEMIDFIPEEESLKIERKKIREENKRLKEERKKVREEKRKERERLIKMKNKEKIKKSRVKNKIKK